jgi:ABC-type amino acid transport substrate-binding protein
MKKRLALTLGLALAATLSFAPLQAVADTSQTGAISGSFTGASEHITTGGLQIIKTADGGAVVILDSDFSLDGAPDPRVGFGKDGAYADASDLGALQNLNGVQVYIVPPSVNVDDFNEVYIWCKKFFVPLGVASLN